MSKRRLNMQQAKITRGCLYILIAVAGVSLVFLMAGADMQAAIAKWGIATDQSVWREGKVWQLVTSPFIEVQLISLLFQGFMLWMFLPALERWWGLKRFVMFAVYTSIAGVAVGTLVGSFLAPGVSQVGGQVVAGYAISGLDSFIFAGIVAYGVLFADQPVQFFGVLPMTGKQLTIGIAGFTAVFIIVGQKWAEGAAIASAMLLAWWLTSSTLSFKLWRLKRKQKKLRRHLKLVKDEDGDEKRWLN